MSSDIQAGGKPAKTGPGWLTLSLFGLALVGVAAVLYVIASAVSKPKANGDLHQFTRGALAQLQIPGAGTGAAMPATPFLDPDGKSVSLADLKGGGVTVVNLWATWCAPCRIEMPTLAKLQASYPGRVKVIPIAMDQAEDREKARAFIGQYGLPFYQDPKLAITFALTPPAEAMPTTLIYDASGHERARLSGGADWNGPEAHGVIDALLGAKQAPSF